MRSESLVRTLIAMAASALAVIGCASPPGPPQAVVDQTLDMFREGVTTRNEMVSVLGPPRMRRGDQVYVYHLGEGYADLGGIYRFGQDRYVRAAFNDAGVLTNIKRYEGPGGQAEEFLASPPAEDLAAKEFRPRPAACTAYVMLGGRSPVTDSSYLFLDGEAVGPVTQSRYYQVLDLSPGPHRLGAGAQGMPGTSSEFFGAIDVECRAGELLFIDHGLSLFCKTGRSGFCFSALDATAGRREVLRRKRVVGLLD